MAASSRRRLRLCHTFVHRVLVISVEDLTLEAPHRRSTEPTGKDTPQGSVGPWMHQDDLENLPALVHLMTVWKSVFINKQSLLYYIRRKGGQIHFQPPPQKGKRFICRSLHQFSRLS